MSATQIHKDFQAQLTELIKAFHKQNPDLFIDDIQIHSRQYANMAKIFAGVSVRIEVQPA